MRIALTTALAAVVFASLLTHGGYYGPGGALVGFTAVIGAAAVLLLGARPARAAWLTAAALAVLALWSVASVAWGGHPNVGWRFCGLAVTGVAAVLAGSSLTGTHRIAALEGIALGMAAHAGMTLAVIGSDAYPSDWFYLRQLEGSVGYHNALGAVYAMGLPLALYLACAPGHVRRFLAGAGAVTLLGAALLTQSRGALAAIVLALTLQSVLSGRARVTAMAVVLGPIGVLLVAALRPVDRALLAAGVDEAPAPGPLMRYAVTVAVASIAVGAVATLAPKLGRIPRRARRATAVTTAALLAVLVAVSITAIATRADNVLDRLTAAPNSASQVPGGETRFVSISSSGRFEQWRLSLEMTREDPLLGHGAGAFAGRWGLERSTKDLYVLQPHSIELEVLAELGAVGGALFAALLAGIGWLLLGGLRRDQTIAAAAAASVLAFVASASVDWVFSFPLLLGIAMLVAGIAGGPGRGRPVSAALCIGTAILALAALAGPALGTWYLERARSAESRSLDQAAGLIDRARAFNPWDPAIVSYRGRVAEGYAQYDRAAELYDRASDLSLQPWTDRYRQARALREAGRIRESRVACREAILSNPLEPELRRGICEDVVD